MCHAFQHHISSFLNYCKFFSTYLKAHNIWSLIELGIQEGADKVTQRKNQLALSQIHEGVDYLVFGKLVNAKTTKEV